jgi:hypothetical protein
MMRGINTGARTTRYKIPLRSTGVEIGVWQGDTTLLFAKRAHHITAVDPWSIVPLKESMDEKEFDQFIVRYSPIVGGKTEKQFTDYYDKLYHKVLTKFENKNIDVFRGTSSMFFTENTKKDYDWVYVDGDHSHDGCLHDLRNSWEIIKSGGILFGDDYPNKPGVVSAVDQFCEEIGDTMERFANNQFLINKL